MVKIFDLDHAELVALGPQVFARLEEGAIFYVRRTPEILALADHVVAVLEARHSPACARTVRGFFQGGPSPGHEDLVALLLVLREIRDTRYASCLFADLVQGFGLPTPVLVDTGYFRCIFQRDSDALRADPRVPRDLYEGLAIDPEPFLKRSNIGGGPHRDVDVPHYTFQINFWFPLHDVPAANSLLLFPDIYTRDVPYQQRPEPLGEPDRWGYGSALRRALRLGDMVLFHSQHFHASPTEAPELDRLTAEIRVAGACIDDNAAVYRRLFWNIRNFTPLAQPDSRNRAERLHPHAPATTDRTPLTAQELLATLFDRPEDVRHGGNLWTPESIFDTSREFPRPALTSLVERLIAAPFAEDRQLALARYLLHWQHRDLAEAVLTDISQRTESYFFALELARIASQARLWQLVGSALMRAFALAQSSPITIGRYRGDVPARPLPRLQFMPEDAIRAATVMIQALRDYAVAPDRTPAPLIDYRLFFPFLISAQPHPSGVVVSVWTILIFIPLHRVAEIGLRAVQTGDRPQMEGVFNPEPLIRDPTGIVTAYSLAELGANLRQAYPVKA